MYKYRSVWNYICEKDELSLIYSCIFRQEVLYIPEQDMSTVSVIESTHCINKVVSYLWSNDVDHISLVLSSFDREADSKKIEN